MKKSTKKFIEKNTISVEEFAKDFTPDQRRISENFTRYYELVLALRKMRQELGFTQAQLAEKAAIPRTTITKLESGSYNPTLKTLSTIAAALNKKLHIEFI